MSSVVLKELCKPTPDEVININTPKMLQDQQLYDGVAKMQTVGLFCCFCLTALTAEHSFKIIAEKYEHVYKSLQPCSTRSTHWNSVKLDNTVSKLCCIVDCNIDLSIARVQDLTVKV